MNRGALLVDSPPTLGHFIDGAFTRSHDLETLNVTDAATGQITALASMARAGDVDGAVQSATRAFHTGSWSRWGRADRAAVLRELADLVASDADRLARIEAADTGLPLHLVKNGHLPRVVDNLYYFAGVAAQGAETALWHDEGFVNLISKEPLGVAGIVTPWNSPTSIASLSLGAAIATGNTCVLKPSELAPLSIHALFVKIASIGLPPGVVNLVHGGAETGRYLVEHPDVDGISFTGSQASGAAVMSAAAPRLARVTCELGGVAPAIVLPDADLIETVEGIMWSAFGSNGAACLTSSIIYAHRDIHEPLALALAQRVDSLRVGDPLDSDTEIGPLVNPAAARRLFHQRDRLTEMGAEVLAPSQASNTFAETETPYFQPTLLAFSTPTVPPQEDMAGPLAVMCPFEDAQTLCRDLNRRSSGLVAYLWGAESDTTRWFARALRFGSVALNAPVARDARTPFGGFRASGLGRVGGPAWIDFWTETKSVTRRA